jgi:hypothetical protein
MRSFERPVANRLYANMSDYSGTKSAMSDFEHQQVGRQREMTLINHNMIRHQFVICTSINLLKCQLCATLLFGLMDSIHLSQLRNLAAFNCCALVQDGPKLLIGTEESLICCYFNIQATHKFATSNRILKLETSEDEQLIIATSGRQRQINTNANSIATPLIESRCRKQNKLPFHYRHRSKAWRVCLLEMKPEIEVNCAI